MELRGVVGMWYGRRSSELLKCREKKELCFERSLGSWAGARPYKEVKTLTSTIFVLLTRKACGAPSSRG